jgi:hypothetical protein
LTVDFLVYRLTAEALYLGERAKGNLLKPCLQTIPYSAISGALNRRLCIPAEGEADGGIKAVGFLEEAVGRNRLESLTYSPRDRVREASKIPLQVEFLADVVATVLVIDNPAASRLPKEFEIVLGGMRSHGFGRAQLKLIEKCAAGDPRQGRLRVRIPEEEAPSFAIKVLVPVYGYLFKRTPGAHPGVYVRALFEGSRVVAPHLLLQPERK